MFVSLASIYYFSHLLNYGNGYINLEENTNPEKIFFFFYLDTFVKKYILMEIDQNPYGDYYNNVLF